MTSGLIAILRVFTISRVRNRIFNIKFCNVYVIIKNSTTNQFIVLITNDSGFQIFKISRIRRDSRFIFKYTGLVNEFYPLVDQLDFNKMSLKLRFCFSVMTFFFIIF